MLPVLPVADKSVPVAASAPDVMRRDVHRLIKSLQQDSSLKVWSLIVTFFGDAIVARGGNVSARTVQTVLSGMGIGAGAVRTAFSRLASDQWIFRHKIGRESFYELVVDGYQPFKSASVRIYSPSHSSMDLQNKRNWTVAVKNPATKTNSISVSGDGMRITSNCWLFDTIKPDTKKKLQRDGFMLLTGDLADLPEWVTDKLLPNTVSQGYVLLEQRFSSIKRADKLEPLESLVLRCLLIHQWRRLLLRSQALPSEMLPDTWPETRCREFVSNLYHMLLPGSEAWLDEYAACADGPLPAPSVDVRLRFTENFNNN